MKSNLISKSETSKILEQIKSQWKIELPKQKNIKTHDVNEKGVIITGDGITAIKIGENIVLKRISVDIYFEKYNLRNTF